MPVVEPPKLSAAKSPKRRPNVAAAARAPVTPAPVDPSVAAPAHSESEARAVVAEALTRLRGSVVRMIQRRYPTLDAGDVYQRASLRALERFASLRERDRVDGWIRRIAVTSALDLLRERRREVALPDDHEVEAPPTPEGDVCSCSLALVNSLPESYEDILRRVDIDGAPLADVAGDLQIATGNAAVRLHRARRALRDRVRSHCGVETLAQCLSCTCEERGCFEESERSGAEAS